MSLLFRESIAQVNTLVVHYKIDKHTVDLSKIMSLEQAYAHNDYWYPLPLWDALSQQKNRYLFIDGRIGARGLNLTTHLPRS